MQHLLYTEDHIALQDSLKKFCEAEINPHIAEWEKAEIFPAKELFRKMGELGFLGVDVEPTARTSAARVASGRRRMRHAVPQRGVVAWRRVRPTMNRRAIPTKSAESGLVAFKATLYV